MSQVHIENITENHHYRYGDVAKGTVALSVIDGMTIYHVMIDENNFIVANEKDEFIGDNETYNKVKGYVNEWVAKTIKKEQNNDSKTK